ncbi:MAG TPA: helix-turn-helix domain-containing protein, partial [Candidatus Limnocylindria bacterium]|nr:helix-turn-helix domain-containing protein [Candidatus Limnocylindria bacterium]
TGKTLAAVEREAIQIALRLTGGNRSAAARMLGISRPRLARKIRDVEQPLASAGDVEQPIPSSSA